MDLGLSHLSPQNHEIQSINTKASLEKKEEKQNTLRFPWNKILDKTWRETWQRIQSSLQTLKGLTGATQFQSSSPIRDNLHGFPLYLWDNPWRFIPITCTDPLSLMMLAWKDLRVSHSSNCCYFGSLSAWYFYIFPAFYCFPSWKTSIGGNVFVFTLCRFLCPGLLLHEHP